MSSPRLTMLSYSARRKVTSWPPVLAWASRKPGLTLSTEVSVPPAFGTGVALPDGGRDEAAAAAVPRTPVVPALLLVPPLFLPAPLDPPQAANPNAAAAAAEAPA